MEKIKDALAKAKMNVSKDQTKQPSNSQKKTNITANITNDDKILEAIAYNKKNSVKLDSVHLENYRIVAQNKNDPTGWIFDSLRTQVLQKMEENNWRTLAVLSPTPEAGKSVVAINLAISIAKQPKRTAILVDFDLRKPRVAQYLGIHREKSLNNFLEGTAELTDIIVNPGIPRLSIVPTNKPVNQSSETLSSSLVQNLVIELKERYKSRIVIFDLPPILNADDAMVILPQVACVLLVVADGQHTEAEIDKTMLLLTKSNILGVVVNKSEGESNSYYY
jgi:protein-tyrosine kinase